MGRKGAKQVIITSNGNKNGSNAGKILRKARRKAKRKAGRISTAMVPFRAPEKKRSRRDNQAYTTIPAHLSTLGTSTSAGIAHVTKIVNRMERVGTILGQTAFGVSNALSINPGMIDTFPWLSGIAKAYELYKFVKLWFEYRTTSGEVVSGGNPALGKVIMTTNYDADAPLFTSVTQMENYEGNCNFPPYQKVARHEIDVSGRKMGQVLPYTRRYVRSELVDPTTRVGGSPDPHAYDIGFLQVGTEGMPEDGNPVGELWVGYSVDLIKPKVVDDQTQTIARFGARYACVQDGSDFLVSVGTTGAGEIYPQNTINVSLPVITNSGTRTFEIDVELNGSQKGEYYIMTLKNFLVTGTANFGTLAVSFGNAATAVTSLGFRTSSSFTLNATTTASGYVIFTKTDTTFPNVGILITIPGGTAHTTSSLLDVTIAPYNMPFTGIALEKGASRIFAPTRLERQLRDMRLKLEHLDLGDEKKEERKDSFTIV